MNNAAQICWRNIGLIDEGDVEAYFRQPVAERLRRWMEDKVLDKTPQGYSIAFFMVART